MIVLMGLSSEYIIDMVDMQRVVLQELELEVMYVLRLQQTYGTFMLFKTCPKNKTRRYGSSQFQVDGVLTHFCT